MPIAAITSICQEDFIWLPQYLREIERLGIKFLMHFDRCEAPESVMNHGSWAGSTWGHGKEFTEQHKQGILDLASEIGFSWALQWDVDETFESKAPGVLGQIGQQLAGYDYARMPWVNLWGDPDHARVDPMFLGCRVKLLNLTEGRRWVFDHPITNGPKLQGREPMLADVDLTCLHWGMMTHELRVMHKERWDRIYAAAVGANPYQFWSGMLDESIKPEVIRHKFFEAGQ